MTKPSMKTVQDFRDQAQRYRQTAGTLIPAIAEQYHDWAADLDRRADALAEAIAANG